MACCGPAFTTYCLLLATPCSAQAFICQRAGPESVCGTLMKVSPEVGKLRVAELKMPRLCITWVPYTNNKNHPPLMAKVLTTLLFVPATQSREKSRVRPGRAPSQTLHAQ
ncbi:hypothetical protein BJ875DRAFT_126136 [Amylocarpus encephaloides]|uniref:Uncharacterized protein n=1 Tax=Amylocarpus encephaloides TaxID=45428 RepID=A0A9P7YQ84_9HELO|nr:hypothetical protein BJ875DRAFT_126136 [Amylocarpus encephaloides]